MRKFLVILSVFTAVSWVCAAIKTYPGEQTNVGDGMARTWLTTDAGGTPLAIGIVFSPGILTGLPETPAVSEYILPLPPQASKTPFQEFALNWNPHGHIPPGIYDTPHFDFHFYMMLPSERILITPEMESTANRPPAPEYIPQGYVMAPGGFEPRMGAHWVDLSGPEFHGHPFTATFIYGFYDARLLFLEPMITLAFLQTKPDFSNPISLPPSYQKSGYYPTRYAVKYEPLTNRYYVALQGLTWREGK